MEIKSFEDLEVWQWSKDLAIEVYGITKDFPKDEVFGITNQIKRAAVSISANIAEGFGRYHYLDKAKFYLNSRGSLFELKSHLLIANDLGFISKDVTNDLSSDIDQLGIKLNNFITATRNKAAKQ